MYSDLWQGVPSIIKTMNPKATIYTKDSVSYYSGGIRSIYQSSMLVIVIEALEKEQYSLRWQEGGKRYLSIIMQVRKIPYSPVV